MSSFQRVCTAWLRRQGQAKPTWRLCLALLLFTTAVSSAPSHIVFGNKEYSCMPQFPAATQPGWNEPLDTSTPFARNLVSIPTTNSCQGPVSSSDSANLTDVAGSILLLDFSSCAFNTFKDLQNDATEQLKYAVQVKASGAVLVLREVGQLPPVLPEGTVPLPTCVMEAQVGADLRSAMGARDRAVIDVTHLASLSVTTAPLATSKNFTMLQIAGNDSQLSGAIPIWPALFNVAPIASRSANRPTTIVAVEWIDGCLSRKSASAEPAGMYAKCATDCWSQQSPFKTDISSRIALFDFASIHSKGQELCYSEYWQMAYKASLDGGAAAVLFTGRDAAKVPVTPGPRDIAGDFFMPAFSLLTKHGSMLAQRVAGDTPVRGTLPKALPNGGGYPSFFDANAIEATTDKLYFEMTGVEGNCTLGRALFSRGSLSLTKDTQAVFGKASGACQLQDGVGCSLDPKFSDPAGKALILYSQDWAYFSAWSELVDLASKAGASALLLVNPDEAVHTLQDASNYTTPMGIWNMDYKCGAALSYLTSQGAPVNVTVGIAISGNRSDSASTSVSTLKTLTDPADQPAYPTTSVQIASSTRQARQALFNPAAFATVKAATVSLTLPATCANSATQGGLDCTSCSPSTTVLEAAAQESLAGQAWVALVPADTANCLLPHESLVNKLQAAGAAGVVFYPSSINSSVQLSAYNARGAVSQIPAVLLLQPPTSTASSQAVTIKGVNSTEASCLQGFSFCDEGDPTLTSVITYSADPYTLDAVATQVLPETPEGGEAATQASQSSGVGVNVAAIVVPIVLGVVLLAAIAGIATYLFKSRNKDGSVKSPSTQPVRRWPSRGWVSFKSSTAFKTFEEPGNQGSSEVCTA
ncbi:hypothetical protein ABBQ32_004625 [Trebouxia sp. C0010 RCD-2024]